MAGLGIDFRQILLHVINVVIVFFVLRKLLYRPISKFMQNRSDKIAAQIEEAAKKESEAEQLKSRYDEMVENAQVLATEFIQKSKIAADDQAKKIVSDAQITANEVMIRSQKDVQLLKSKAKEEMRGEITDMAVHIAKKILKREVSSEDNKEIINTFFNGKEI
jgi:F-type H+-transporting ATPase subunit b